MVRGSLQSIELSRRHSAEEFIGLSAKADDYLVECGSESRAGRRVGAVGDPTGIIRLLAIYLQSCRLFGRMRLGKPRGPQPPPPEARPLACHPQAVAHKRRQFRKNKKLIIL